MSSCGISCAVWLERPVSPSTLRQALLHDAPWSVRCSTENGVVRRRGFRVVSPQPQRRLGVRIDFGKHICTESLYYGTNTHSMSMYSLSSASGTPIYRQLVDQTSQLVASGRLGVGDLLPSVRTVAAELGVNPMTVSKAYSLLEREGVVARRRGMGMVVAENRLDAADAIRPQADALVSAARRLRLTRKGVADAVDTAWERHEQVDMP